MPSVARFARHLKQPKGGYLKPSQFTKIIIDPDFEPLVQNKLPPGFPMVEGICVETLVRLANGMTADEVLQYIFRRNDPEVLPHFPKLIQAFKTAASHSTPGHLVDELVPLTYRLFQFAWWYLPRRRHNLPPVGMVNESVILNPVFQPTAQQIYNIRRMAENSPKFVAKFGAMDFQPIDLTGAFTKQIRSAEIDFRTHDTIWEMKDSKNPPTRFHTMQVLIYFLLVQHSHHPDPNLTKIGIFNPRLSVAYVLEVAKIDPKLIQFVETDLIGYPKLN